MRGSAAYAAGRSTRQKKSVWQQRVSEPQDEWGILPLSPADSCSPPPSPRTPSKAFLTEASSRCSSKAAARTGQGSMTSLLPEEETEDISKFVDYNHYGDQPDMAKVVLILEDLARKMDRMGTGQKVVERILRKMSNQDHEDRAWSGCGGAAEKASSAGTIGQRDTDHRMEHMRMPPQRRSLSTASNQSWSDKEQQSVLGFWPRTEWTTAHISIRNKSASFKTLDFTTLSLETTLEPAKSRLRKACYVHALHPECWLRTSFDVLVILALFWDSLSIPYSLAWPSPPQDWALPVFWCYVGFWSIDLFLGFVTGYHEKGGVVMDLRRIRRHYMSGAFIPDLFVVVADCLDMYLKNFGTEGTVFYRLVRLTKLRRMVRLAHSMRKVVDARDRFAAYLRSQGILIHEQFAVLSRMFQLLLYMVWLNHLCCCLWFVVGEKSFHKWYSDHYGLDFSDVERGGILEYLLGFYCSATAIIAGGTIMMPGSIAELAVLVCYVVLGFILTSVLISSLLAAVMEYQDANRERTSIMKRLDEFLYQQRIDQKLAVSIVKQVHERMWSNKRLGEGDVEALSLLSPVLRSELWCQIYGPKVMEFPFLKACNAMRGGVVKELCFRTLQQTSEAPGSLVFEPNVEAIGAFYVCQGKLDYAFQQDEDEETMENVSSAAGRRNSRLTFSSSRSDGKAMAKEGAWISEASLWAHWLHRGWLDARTHCTLLTVEAEKFVNIMASHAELVYVCKCYASCLLKTLQDCGSQFSDLQLVPHHTVVAAMPLDARVKLSKAAMDHLQTSTRWYWNREGLRDLKDEVSAGTCDLVMVGDDVQRVVTVVTLRLRRENGTILAKLAKLSNGNVVPTCELPGGKVKVGEYPKDAIDRIITEKLGPIAAYIRLGSEYVDVQEKVSKTYGLKSKYIRTVVEAELQEEPEDYKISLVKRDPSGTSSAPSKIPSSGRISFSKNNNLNHMMHHVFKSDQPQNTWEDDRDAFAFNKDVAAMSESFSLFAWLREEDFQLLSMPQNEAQLQSWTMELDLGPLGDLDREEIPDVKPPETPTMPDWVMRRTHRSEL